VHRVAIDIGGTFTDLATVDADAGALVISKASTTPVPTPRQERWRTRGRRGNG
jgi:N-methylhydantoinase A/oxoprolinase/acetone carboxylase beta subunit